MSLTSKGRGRPTSLLSLCPNSAWVVLDQCCIGWINTAVSHQLIHTPNWSLQVGREGAVERTLHHKNLPGNLFFLQDRNCMLAMPGLPQAIVDDPKARLYGRPVGVSRSGHAEALEVQRKGCLPLRLWYWTSDNTFSRQAPHFYWARFSWILSRLQSKRRSSRDLPKVRAEDRLLAVASKSHSTEVIPTILPSDCSIEIHVIHFIWALGPYSWLGYEKPQMLKVGVHWCSVILVSFILHKQPGCWRTLTPCKRGLKEILRNHRTFHHSNLSFLKGNIGVTVGDDLATRRI